MQPDIEDLENEDPEKFEEDESIAELCGVPRTPYKLNKRGRALIGDFVDRLRREDASKIANVQDSNRHPIGSTRYDINSYAGGPATIRDLCFIEKRKVR